MPISDYIIYSDISADIPAAYAVEKDIRFIPMSYTLGSEDRVCSSIEPEKSLKSFTTVSETATSPTPHRYPPLCMSRFSSRF